MGYKLKRILIYPDGVTEKQVYPRPVFNFSYNFTTGSTSDFTSKGFTVPSGVTINSSGMSATAWKDIYSTVNQTLNDVLQSANYIEFEIVHQLAISSGTSGGDFGLGICKDGEDAWTNATFMYGWVRGFRYYVAGTSYEKTQSSNISNGTYTATYKLDFNTKIATINDGAIVNTTKALTDADITKIRTSNKIYIPISHSEYIKTISVKIY